MARSARAGGVPGTRGLALFYVELRDEDTGKLRGICVDRLKEKLGTKQLPTAEMTLEGTPATQLSPVGAGVASIGPMFNLTRIHNAVTAASYMRRAVSLCRDYATRRVVFGSTLDKKPLALGTLAWMEVHTRSAMLLCLDCGLLLGRAECEGDARAADTLRLLTPVLKLFTAKQAVAVFTEAMEFFGGVGYIEDSGLPSLVRDSHVLPIWEGCTNVLSLDVMRALSHVPHALDGVRASALERCQPARNGALSRVASRAAAAVEAASSSPPRDEPSARPFAFALARACAAALLVEHAAHTGDDLDVHAAERWLDVCRLSGERSVPLGAHDLDRPIARAPGPVDPGAKAALLR